jgi:hypothetical protein
MHTKRYRTGSIAVLVMAVAVGACSLSDSDKKDSSASTIPPDKKDYIGNWQGGPMKLNIAADGGVEYERKEGSSSKSLNGKITKFIGNDFEVKAFVITTTFKVEKPPSRDGSVWKMVVDGVEVRREDTSGGTSSSTSGDKSQGMRIGEMRMAKDDGQGGPGNVANTFPQNEKTIHCEIEILDPQPGAKLKAVWTDTKNNEVMDESDSTIPEKDNNYWDVRLNYSTGWRAGRYRVEVQVNGKPAKSVEFTVE